MFNTLLILVGCDDMDAPKMVKRNCIICGKEYSYKAYTSFFWKGTRNPFGIGDIVSSKAPKDRVSIWPNDCCEEHRNLDDAKKYMEAQNGR